jgi:hypothetical protein
MENSWPTIFPPQAGERNVLRSRSLIDFPPCENEIQNAEIRELISARTYNPLNFIQQMYVSE